MGKDGGAQWYLVFAQDVIVWVEFWKETSKHLGMIQRQGLVSMLGPSKETAVGKQAGKETEECGVREA